MCAVTDADIIPLRPHGICQRCLKALGDDYHADEDDRRYCPRCCPDCTLEGGA